MTVTYTFDVFSSLDSFGGYDEHGDWGGYWGKDGPEFLQRRLDLYAPPHRVVLGATTFKMFVSMIGPGSGAGKNLDPVNDRMRSMPTTVISNTLEGPQDWPDATIEHGDAVEIVARLKAESEVPLRSHGSLSLNRALMAAGLVDRLQLTIFPVITGRTGDDPLFAGADDFDLELLESHLLDGRTQELVYRPTLHQAVTD
jgi:dihydrofolate reductase